MKLADVPAWYRRTLLAVGVLVAAVVAQLVGPGPNVPSPYDPSGVGAVGVTTVIATRGGVVFSVPGVGVSTSEPAP